MWLVARHAAALVLVGAAIGIPAALALSRLVKDFPFRNRTADATAIVSGVIALVLVAALASAIPGAARDEGRSDGGVAAGLSGGDFVAQAFLPVWFSKLIKPHRQECLWHNAHAE